MIKRFEFIAGWFGVYIINGWLAAKTEYALLNAMLAIIYVHTERKLQLLLLFPIKLIVYHEMN